jgi:hypothetical protein
MGCANRRLEPGGILRGAYLPMTTGGVFVSSVCWDEQPYEQYLSAQPFFYVDPQYHLLRSYR